MSNSDSGTYLQAAIDVAPGHTRMADVYDAANELLGSDRTHSAWRSLLYRNQAARSAIYKAMAAERPLRRVDTVAGAGFDAAEYFRAQVAASEAWAKRKRPVTDAQVAIPTDAPVGIVFSSDWHIGNEGTDHRRILADNEVIAGHPRLFAALGGDGTDNFVDGMRLSHAGHNPVFDYGGQQWAIFRHLLQPLVDSQSILYVSTGNHDGWTTRVAGIDATLGHLQGVPELYVGQGAVITLIVGSITYRVFRRHRNRWSSVHNPHHAVVMEYQCNSRDFDAGVIEHQHQPGYALFDGKRRPDGTTKRVSIRTGTYKTLDPHAQEFGYDYGAWDLPVLLLWPDRFYMQPVLGLDNAIELLDALR